jgi:hypothetical protein
MRNYAFHHYPHIGPRTFVALRELDLLEEQADPIGTVVDVEVLLDLDHPRNDELPPGPLLHYLTQDEKPKRMLIEIPVLLLSQLSEVRKAASARLEKMVAMGSLEVTPKTRDLLEKARNDLMSDAPNEWRPASIVLSDAFSDDVLVALQGVRQSLMSEPVFQGILNSYVPRVLNPSISSLDSIALDIRDPEKEQPKLVEIVTTVAVGATSLEDACARYFARLGYLPLAPDFALSEVVSRWIAHHPEANAWQEVWDWARAAIGPLPRYHACSVFAVRPDLIPEGKLAELWREIISVVHVEDTESLQSTELEPWMLRQDLTRLYVRHLEAHLPGNESAGIACLSWWLAERTASILPNDPTSVEFYRKNWVTPAADRSSLIWRAASTRMGSSFLRYLTHTVGSPWATSLLALMGTNLERLALHDQPTETQTRFYDALVSCLIGSLPFSVEPSANPTYAMEYPLGATALKCGANLGEEQRGALEQIVSSSRTLGSAKELCEALRELAEKPLADQVAITLGLKALAYRDSTMATGVWEILSDAGWRQRVLVSVENGVMGLLLEAFGILQVQNQGQWFSLLPHYLAELCEKAENEERRRLLFLHVVYTSLAADSVSAVRRLLRGVNSSGYMQYVAEFREHFEGMWSSYPPWAQGRVRSLLASLRAD